MAGIRPFCPSAESSLLKGRVQLRLVDKSLPTPTGPQSDSRLFVGEALKDWKVKMIGDLLASGTPGKS